MATSTQPTTNCNCNGEAHQNDVFDPRFIDQYRQEVSERNRLYELQREEQMHSESNFLNRAVILGHEAEAQRIKGLLAIGAVLEAIQSTTKTTRAAPVRIAA